MHVCVCARARELPLSLPVSVPVGAPAERSLLSAGGRGAGGRQHIMKTKLYEGQPPTSPGSPAATADPCSPGSPPAPYQQYHSPAFHSSSDTDTGCEDIGTHWHTWIPVPGTWVNEMLCLNTAASRDVFLRHAHSQASRLAYVSLQHNSPLTDNMVTIELESFH